jgi:GT2 family glycosyltransferase
MEKYPEVAIVVLNWNSGGLTADCIRSLQGLTYAHFRIVVPDNGSTDGSAGMIQAAFPGIRLVENGKNLGFAGGNNPGIRLALAEGADYVLLLNNDTEVDPSFLDELVRVAESDPEIGIASPKIYFYSEPDRLWFAGGRIDFWKGQTLHLGDGEIDDGKYDQVGDTGFVSGCAMLVKRKVFEDIGLLYEPMFLYYEDSDFCARALRAGYRIVMAPKARIWHKVSSTTGKVKDLQWFYGTRNMLIFEKRNAGIARLAFFIPYYLAKFVVYNAIMAAAHGDLKKAGLILKAAAEGVLA